MASLADIVYNLGIDMTGSLAIIAIIFLIFLAIFISKKGFSMPAALMFGVIILYYYATFLNVDLFALMNIVLMAAVGVIIAMAILYFARK